MILAAMALELGDYAVIGGMLVAIATITTKLMSFYLKSLNERITVVETRVREVEDKKVDKRDWLRDLISTRSKIDKVSEQIAGVHSKLDAEFGIAAAMNRLADSVGKMTERKGS